MSQPGCNHVKDIVPWPAGSWVNRKTAIGVRVECSVCGELYGYRGKEKGGGNKQLEEGKQGDQDDAKTAKQRGRVAKARKS